MRKTTFIHKVVVAGICTAIGFGGIMASGEATPSAQAASAASTGSNIVGFGKNFLGVPYRFGASTSTTRNFDCSSFTKYIFKRYGVNLPRTSVAQSKVGRAVSKSNLRAGDLVFFSSGARANGRNVTHVAVYAGNGKILHTYGSPGVTVSNLNSGNWKRTYLKARRVL
ncbi:C40 family peptidase [Paenibacillus sabinae]|uniref:NLP/P60 protein n=1 Tax=Paenibacillus sabinae T27 TaxID=1268072 RepID=X4ZM04_9BACL|nr:C40 family peptidase [Paenibacillus sabinae]AHV97705.1 NLP/P60 protein [Paenibacillus sabinae T27]